MSLINFICVLLCLVFYSQSSFQAYREEMEEIVENIASMIYKPLDTDETAYDFCPKSCGTSYYDECISISA